MTETPDPLADNRALRDKARASLASRLSALQTGLKDRPIGQRLTDEAMARARSAAGEAKDIALGNKGVIAATGAPLAGWLLRKPLRRGLSKLMPSLADGFARLRDQLAKGVHSGETGDE